MDGERKADLVLEGGGVKGIGLVGAVQGLMTEGYTKFPRVAGTSAGAIVGALAAAGMPGEQMEATMRTLDYTKFRDGDPLVRWGGLPGQLVSLVLRQGIYQGDYAHAWLTRHLADLGVHTFGDLREDDPDSALEGEKAYRLVVIVSDVSRNRMVRLPWEYASAYGLNPDDVPVADAVRASMSIPFYYRPVILKGARGSCTLVDGGMLSNFPIDAFDRTDGRRSRWPTFGVKLSARPGEPLPPVPVHGVAGLSFALLSTLLTAHDARHLDDERAKRTVFVDTSGVSATNFGIDQRTQQKLYTSGYDAAQKFLKDWQP